MKVKAKCARALISYLKAKESERENSNELCKTKLYYSTRRHCICGQNKNDLCLHAVRTLGARHMTQLCIYQATNGNAILDVIKPITLPIFEQASQINGCFEK